MAVPCQLEHCCSHRPSRFAASSPSPVFVDVEPHMRIWKEEIFGPVLSGARARQESCAALP